MRRQTCTEQPRVARRNFIGVPGQQVEVLSSEGIQISKGECSVIKGGFGVRRTDFLIDTPSISTRSTYWNTGPWVEPTDRDDDELIL